MSKNISNLSGRIGLKNNLFKQISENALNNSPKDLKEMAKEYHLGVSTLHGAESFYEFLRPSHRKKKASNRTDDRTQTTVWDIPNRPANFKFQKAR